jgi:hypothetical protein
MRVTILAIMALLAAPFAAAQAAREDAGGSSIEGCWQTQLSLGTALSGPIELRRQSNVWLSAAGVI